MGPYCTYCDHRCFVPNPIGGQRATILATCQAGKDHDRRSLGYDIDTIRQNPDRKDPAMGARFDTEKYRNAMIGLAAGDAWGYQVEFTTYDRLDGPVAPPEGLWLISDDTQMTLALETALRRSEHLGVYEITGHIVSEFIAWADSPLNDRAPGTTCMGSLRRLDEGGYPWHHPSLGAIESAGCGAVMRLLPAAMSERERWLGLTALQAVVTHRHPLAVLSALLMGEAVRTAPLRRGHLVGNALRTLTEIEQGTWVGLADPMLREVLAPVTDNLTEWLGSEVPTMRAHLTAAHARLWANDVAGDPCDGVGEGWDAGTATALALMVADAPLMPYAALQWAATSNGDSDSIAAMAGMIIGASSREEGFWYDHDVVPIFEPVYEHAIERGRRQRWDVADNAHTMRVL
ncbi:ADP-ribosylglycohydrolase [Gordonia phage ObLaDi]|uniref:ADP-ribosylglycohydrolase n=1 Tax=Gordonia phage ObLaDi TaxID=2978487 RepID=A0A977PQZ7_9CAUD|nr:ADP-ribosylglycohydrolase [Gordonia phage ObLaDi]